MFSRGDIRPRTDLTLLMLTMILPTPLLTLLTPEKALCKPRCHQLTGMSPLCGQILWYLRPVCIKHALRDGHIHTHSSIHTHAVGGWTVYTQTTAQASTCRRLDIPCQFRYRDSRPKDRPLYSSKEIDFPWSRKNLRLEPVATPVNIPTLNGIFWHHLA